jgi:hypothetical protein
MTNHTFTIGADGRIERSTFNVTQGDRPNVMFDNTSGRQVTVNVTGVPGTRAVPDHPTPFAPALFPDQNMTFTVPVPAATKPFFEAQIGPSPNRGTYRLSTDASRSDDSEGTITVQRITITIHADGHLSSGNFDVTRGAELRVVFENLSAGDVTVYVTGPSESTSGGGSLFRVGANRVMISDETQMTSTGVTVAKGVEIVRVPKAGTGLPETQPVISASARVGNFIISTEYPASTAPCNPWINIHM